MWFNVVCYCHPQVSLEHPIRSFVLPPMNCHPMSPTTQVWSGVSPQLLKTSICERGSLALLVLPSWSQTWTMTPQLLTQAFCTTADD